MVNIRNLAGVPAVIFGVLGLIIFVEWLEPVTSGETVITAGLTMAILVLPIVIITSMEAIRAVPQGLRDAGYGVGASRWEVTRDHVLPYAAPGILTGTVLAIARALGEAAPLILIGAITGLLPRTGLTENFTALPMLIFNWAGRPNSPGAEISWSNAAAAGRPRPARRRAVLQRRGHPAPQPIREEASRHVTDHEGVTTVTDQTTAPRIMAVDDASPLNLSEPAAHHPRRRRDGRASSSTSTT